MKILVTAASKHDSGREIAWVIGEVLRSRGFAATVARPEDVRRIDRYDAVVVGSSVYSGQWLRPARKLIARAAGALASRPVWTFSAAPEGEATAPNVGAIRLRGHHSFERGAHSTAAVMAGAWANEIADALTTPAAA
jgi:menaquinone-dependent protoporphyrinogen IX oxidase